MNLTWEFRSCPLCGSTAEGKVIVESNVELSRLTEFAFASRKLPEYMHSRTARSGGRGAWWPEVHNCHLKRAARRPLALYRPGHEPPATGHSRKHNLSIDKPAE